MENLVINHWAVLSAAALNLLVGAIWYSPALFYNAWKKENGLVDEEFKNVSMGKMYGISFLLALIICYNLAFFLGDTGTNWSWGLFAGFLTGFGFCSTIFAAIALFELKSWKYILINSGYIIVYFSLAGLILGLWR